MASKSGIVPEQDVSNFPTSLQRGKGKAPTNLTPKGFWSQRPQNQAAWGPAPCLVLTLLQIVQQPPHLGSRNGGGQATRGGNSAAAAALWLRSGPGWASPAPRPRRASPLPLLKSHLKSRALEQVGDSAQPPAGGSAPPRCCAPAGALRGAAAASRGGSRHLLPRG